MDTFKKKMVKKCGPGGLNCTCCNPFHHKGKSKDKRKLNRIARRTLKYQDIRDALNMRNALNFPDREVICHNFAFPRLEFDVPRHRFEFDVPRPRPDFREGTDYTHIMDVEESGRW